MCVKKEDLAIEKFQKAAEETNLMTSKMGRSEGGNGDGDQGERHCPGDWGMAVKDPGGLRHWPPSERLCHWLGAGGESSGLS